MLVVPERRARRHSRVPEFEPMPLSRRAATASREDSAEFIVASGEFDTRIATSGPAADRIKAQGAVPKAKLSNAAARNCPADGVLCDGPKRMQSTPQRDTPAGLRIRKLLHAMGLDTW